MVRHEIGKIFRPSLHQVRHGGQTTKNLAWHRRPLGRQFEQSRPLVSFNLLSHSLFARGIDPHSSPLSHGSLLALRQSRKGA